MSARAVVAAVGGFGAAGLQHPQPAGDFVGVDFAAPHPATHAFAVFAALLLDGAARTHLQGLGVAGGIEKHFRVHPDAFGVVQP